MATNEESASPAGRHGGTGGAHGKSGGTVWADLRDAISLRAFLLVVGTLGLGVGFVLSYVGALHNPRLQNLPITVVSDSPQVTNQLIGQLTSSVPSGLIVPSAGTTVAAATRQVKERNTGAAFVYDVSGTQDKLIVASAAGSAQSTAVENLFTAVDQRQHRTLTVVDTVPAGAKDFDGLSAFYLVVGWCVTGYLIASILGISAGTRPSTTTRAVVRLVAIALSGFVAAVVGTWLVQQHILGSLSGAFWPMVATGTLLILGVGAITMAMQIALGVLGIGAAVLLVVVLGNPSAGGAFPRSMLPTFWRAIGAFLPPGAGTDAVRSISYFGGAATGYPLLIMGGYALLGVILSLLLCVVKAPVQSVPSQLPDLPRSPQSPSAQTS
jgi:hypothetical protein